MLLLRGTKGSQFNLHCDETHNLDGISSTTSINECTARKGFQERVVKTAIEAGSETPGHMPMLQPDGGRYPKDEDPVYYE